MRAVRVHEYEQDPLDVIVKVGGAGVCRTDLHIVNGDWAEIQEPALPYVIGHENAGTDQVVRPLLSAGRTVADVAAMTLGGAPTSADLDRLRARRGELGLPTDDTAPLVIDPAVGAVGLDALPLHLRKARSYAVGVDANTSICRGQLAARYGT